MKKMEAATLKEFIAQNRVDLACEHLKNVLNVRSDQRLSDELAQLLARLNELEKQFLKNNITAAEYEIALNRVRKSAMLLIDAADGLGYLGKKKQNLSSIKWWASAVFIGVIIIIAVQIKLLNTPEQNHGPKENHSPVVTQYDEPHTTKTLTPTGTDKKQASPSSAPSAQPPSPVQPTVTVTVIFDSSIQDSLLFIDGVPANVSEEGLTFKKVKVLADMNHTFKIGKASRSKYIKQTGSNEPINIPSN